MFNANSQIKFKTMLKSCSCDYSDVYNLFKGTLNVPNTTAAGAATNDANKN